MFGQQPDYLNPQVIDEADEFNKSLSLFRLLQSLPNAQENEPKWSIVCTMACDLTSLTSTLACEQALHLGESRDVAGEQHAKGDTSARVLHRTLARSLASTSMKQMHANSKRQLFDSCFEP